MVIPFNDINVNLQIQMTLSYISRQWNTLHIFNKAPTWYSYPQRVLRLVIASAWTPFLCVQFWWVVSRNQAPRRVSVGIPHGFTRQLEVTKPLDHCVVFICRPIKVSQIRFKCGDFDEQLNEDEFELESVNMKCIVRIDLLRISWTNHVGWFKKDTDFSYIFINTKGSKLCAEHKQNKWTVNYYVIWK